MSRTRELIPLTTLRDDAPAVLKRVQASTEPLVITDEGRAAAIMLSVDAYERAEGERRLLRMLLQGEREIDAGIGYDLGEVLAEADALLADEHA